MSTGNRHQVPNQITANTNYEEEGVQHQKSSFHSAPQEKQDDGADSAPANRHRYPQRCTPAHLKQPQPRLNSDSRTLNRELSSTTMAVNPVDRQTKADTASPPPRLNSDLLEVARSVINKTICHHAEYDEPSPITLPEQAQKSRVTVPVPGSKEAPLCGTICLALDAHK